MPLNLKLHMISNECDKDQTSCPRQFLKMCVHVIFIICSPKGDVLFYPKILQKGRCKLGLQWEALAHPQMCLK